jgi:hypothetical protein
MSYQALERKITRFTNSTALFLFAICFVGAVIRLYYFPHNIPFSLDTLSYFFYANDVSILGKLPTGYHFPNNGWPIFVSFFFSIFHSNNFLDYMNLQRYLSILISILTVIPVYFLCKRFVEKQYCLLGAALFAFDPRIIQNSLAGDTQPLFIFLGAVALSLFLSKRMEFVYISFFVVALSSLVRYEGLLLIAPFAIMYLVRFRKERRVIPKFCFAIALFLLVIIPTSYIRTESIGNDGLTSQVVSGAVAADMLMKEQNENSGINFILNGFVNLSRFLGLVLIPIFIFFVPLGAFYFVRKKDYKMATILFVFFIMLVPALYAYARDIKETRYLYFIFPIFCVFASFAIKKILSMTKAENLILMAIIGGVIVASLAFLDYKKVDYEHEREAFEISRYVSKLTRVTNDYYPEIKYIRVPLETEFPAVINGTKFGPEVIPVDGFDSLEAYIESTNNRLDHLVVDGSENRPAFLNDVYFNEQRYPYLIKEFDSSELGFSYHVKIYKIDYEKFIEYKNS